MKRLGTRLLFALFLFFPVLASGAQEPKVLPLRDERYKADILLVVAHPDDEGAATPYLARALDEHKRVAVVICTRGSSGANQAGAEQAAALGDIREIEARNAMATLGITNVWFLGGKDTASQNVLQSLANWGHGGALEQIVRLVRLTPPAGILTFLPGIFIGENIAYHQTSAVLATDGGWTEDMHFVLGKSLVGGSVTGDVFEGITAGAIPFARPDVSPEPARSDLSVELGGSYSFYAEFRRVHGLNSLPHPEPPEIAVQSPGTLAIPFWVRNQTAKTKEITLSVSLPAGWTLQSGTGKFTVTAEQVAAARIEVNLPSPAEHGGEKTTPREINVPADSKQETLAEIETRVERRVR